MYYYNRKTIVTAGFVFIMLFVIIGFAGGFLTKTVMDVNKKVVSYGIYETVELTKEEVVDLVYGNPNTTLIVMEH